MGARGKKSRAELSTPAPFDGRAPRIRPTLEVIQPPRALGTHGKALWDRTVADFDVSSSAAAELLCAACQALDRAEHCAEQIARDGLMLNGRENPLIKHELASRAFSAKVVQRLGLDSL